MKSQEEFRVFYSNVLDPIIKPLEEYRAKNAIKLRRRFLTSLYCLPLIGIGLIDLQPYIILLSAIPTFVSLGLTYQTYNDMNKKLRYRFKNNVLGRAIDFYFESYEYIANQQIAKSVIIKSMLFPRSISRVKGEDFMRFKIGSTNIMFCETKVYKRRDRLIFNGIFISASFNKYFNSKTFVISKKSSILLFGIISQLFSKRKNINLESPEFKSQFLTVSGDQVEARYILTPGLMQRILAYKYKTKKNISFSFIKNRLYCVVPKIHDLFEVPFLKPIDFDCIIKSLEPIILYTDIIDDLNLNLKIWSKQ